MSALPVMTPFDQGRQAQRVIDIAENPYTVGTPERAEWASGWYRGRATCTKHQMDKMRLTQLSDHFRDEADRLRRGK